MQGKMAIVGNAATITVFRAAGVDAFSVNDEKGARETLRKVARDYSVIFLTEDYAVKLMDFLKRFDEEPYPVILPVPSGVNTGYGKEFLKSTMERALGVDILFRD